MNSTSSRLIRIASAARKLTSLRRFEIFAAIVLALCVADPWAQRDGALAGLSDDMISDAAGAAERYVLPITPPIDQGESDLCWVFATLSMLETNYMVRHPGSRIELSRGALQFDSIADRFRRLLRGESGPLEDGGLAVEALALIRQNGLIEQNDFHDILDSEPIFSSIREKLAGFADVADKQKALDEALQAILGVKPQTTHLGGQVVSPKELARAVLGSDRWMEFDLSRDGSKGEGPSHDPDARPETRVRYVTLDVMVDLIHRSLKRGEALVWGSADHALLIYGGDYDADGKPLSYLIKDSLAPYVYREKADTIHRMLNDVTVALHIPDPDTTSSRSDSVGSGSAKLGDL